ncbi:glycosyltransferase family 4 protein [Marinomonas epiphytica]
MADPLNVLHICISTGFGGLELYPIRLGKAMKESGHQVFGIALENTPTAQGMQEAYQEVLTLPSRGYGLRHLFALAKWIKRHRITQVHCHKSSDLVLAVLLKKLCRFKLIYTDHMGVRRNKKDAFHRFIYRNLDLLLSISHFTRSNNVKALPVPEDKNITLWHGTQLDLTGLRNLDLKKELALQTNMNIIGIIGRLSHGKGHGELLEAFSLLKHERAHLVIVGGLTAQEGGDEKYVKELQDYVEQHGLQNKVTFYGFTDSPESLIKAMDIVVIPSYMEAFGLTVIEAMAVGKAIIGSSHGAIPEILEDSGLLIDPFDCQGMADALDALCENPAERNRLAQASRARAEAFFGQKHHLDQLISLYRGC